MNISLDEWVGLAASMFLAILGLCMVVVGIQLCRGKWYRVIAGNSQADKKTIEEQKKQKLGLGVGIALFVMAFVVLFTAGYTFSQLKM